VQGLARPTVYDVKFLIHGVFSLSATPGGRNTRPIHPVQQKS
jgi:hypothetical protein